MKLNKETLYVTGTKILSFIEHYAKQIISLILIIVVVFSIKGCAEKARENEALRELSVINDSSLNRTIINWKDKYGNEHARVEQLFVEKKLLNNKVDSIAGVLKIKPKQVTAFSKTGETIDIKGKLHVEPVYRDTSKAHNLSDVYATNNIDTNKIGYNFSWADAWVNVKGNIGITDSINITGTDTLKRTDYWKRKWFLGSKHYYTDFSNSNPHIKVTGFNGVELYKKNKNWSVGIDASIGYPLNSFNLNKPTLFIGIGVQKTIFRF
jgi:uncharacterized protein DUF6549